MAIITQNKVRVDFSRFFKKQEGQTFTAFRDAIRKNDNNA